MADIHDTTNAPEWNTATLPGIAATLAEALALGRAAAGIVGSDGDEAEEGGPVLPLHLDLIGDALAGLAGLLGYGGAGSAAALGRRVGQAERAYGEAEDSLAALPATQTWHRRRAAAVDRAGDATYDLAQQALGAQARSLTDAATQLILLAETIDGIDGAPGTDDDLERLAIVRHVIAGAALVVARAVGLDFADLGRGMLLGAFERDATALAA